MHQMTLYISKYSWAIVRRGQWEGGRRKLREQRSDLRTGKLDVNHPERHNQMETPVEGMHPTACKPKQMISEVEQRKQCGQPHH